MAAELDVDAIIDKLLDVKSARPGKQVNLTEGEIKGLCKTSREVFMSQPILLELEAPIKICGTSRWGVAWVRRDPAVTPPTCSPHHHVVLGARPGAVRAPAVLGLSSRPCVAVGSLLLCGCLACTCARRHPRSVLRFAAPV